jgi:tetratricopeptide (TPR) repeat protein
MRDDPRSAEVKTKSPFRIPTSALICGLLFSGASCAGDLQRATLPPTYTVDLESGRVGVGGPQDLFWQAKTRTERCIGPNINSHVLLAPLPAADFDKADAAKIAGLPYAQHCFTHTDSGGEVKKGFTFAVRTVEGNFAKVRVTGVSARNHLDIEWQLFQPPAAPGGSVLQSSNPSLEIPRLFEQARQLLRSQRGKEAIPPVQQAVTLAERLPQGSRIRIETLSQAGSLLWSAENYKGSLAEPVLLAAVKQIDAAPNAASQETVSMTYRMLGVVYRDQQRFKESIPWFQRAVRIDEARPESTPQLAGQKYFTMSSNLRALSEAQCRAGDAPGAEAADQKRLEACGRSPNPWSVGSCRDGKRPCKDGWMQNGPPVTYERKKK